MYKKTAIITFKVRVSSISGVITAQTLAALYWNSKLCRDERGSTLIFSDSTHLPAQRHIDCMVYNYRGQWLVKFPSFLLKISNDSFFLVLTLKRRERTTATEKQNPIHDLAQAPRENRILILKFILASLWLTWSLQNPLQDHGKQWCPNHQVLTNKELLLI